MDLSVLFIGTPDASSLRAVPKGLSALETTPQDAAQAAAGLRGRRVLVVEREARASAQTFAAALHLDPAGGILGGCASEANGALRFGSVFAAVPYGPYDVEAFSLIDVTRNSSDRPQPDGIDAVAPGVYLVDGTALAEAGLDPNFGSPWRAYDLCVRLRTAGRPVRWDSRLVFALHLGLARPADAIDHREFAARWGKQLAAHFDLETPARGGIRRALRFPLGQREVVTVRLPPTDLILHGSGDLDQNKARESTRVRLASVRDVRADDAAALLSLREHLRGRSDRYLAVVDAGVPPDDRWLERMLVELEWAPNVCAVRERGRTLLALARIPLDVQPPPDAADIDGGVEGLLVAAEQRARSVRRLDGSTNASRRARRDAGGEDVRVSVVVVAHSTHLYHRTTFEGIYAGDLGVDYHVVATPARAESIDALKSYPTLDVIVDDSRGLAAGVNAALSRAQGAIVIIVGDDFYPPPGWIQIAREAFAVRPETGIIGFSAVAVDGPQRVDAGYGDLKAFRAYAGQRRATMKREARLTDRLSALALVLDARALAAVGGFDERLGAGRWGVEDLTLRMRAAGYGAYVSEDLFAHRFDLKEAEPFLNEAAEEARRGQAFAEKWGIAGDPAAYEPGLVVARGFDPQRDFIPIRDMREVAQPLRERYDAIFVATCADRQALDGVAASLRRYFRAFEASDAVLFAVGVAGELDIEAVSARARAVARKLEIDAERAADVAISKIKDAPVDWLETLGEGRRIVVLDAAASLPALEKLDDQSPSGYRRALEAVVSPR